MSISAREYWSGSTNGQSIETGNAGHTRQRIKTKQNQKKPNTMCVGHHYPQAKTNNVNKTWALLQTAGGKDEQNIVCMRKSQHGTQNVKSHNRKTKTTKKMNNTNR